MVKRLAAPLRSESVSTLLRYAARRTREDRLPQVAGSLTFTTMLSLVPLFTVAFALMTAFPIFDTFRVALQDWMFDSLVPEKISSQILSYLNIFSMKAKGLTAAGLAGLAITAVMMLLTIENALNGIWRVRRPRPIGQRLLMFWAVLTVGPLLIGASLSLSSVMVSSSAEVLQRMPFGLSLMVKLVPVALAALAFALLYFFVPNTKVQRRDAMVGGVLAALAFELTKFGFGLFVTRFPTYTAIYGAFAAFPMFLLWLYLSWLVTLFGAAITATLPVIRGGIWRLRNYPGARFYLALGVLGHLYLCRGKNPAGLGEIELAGLQRQDPAIVQGMLAELEAMHLVGRLEDGGADARWVMVCDPERTPVNFVYRAFALDPKQLGRTPLAQLLGSRLTQFRERLEGMWDGVSLATLFNESQGEG